MKHATLGFLLKYDSSNCPTDILLAMKKQGFGKGNYNGFGGKLEPSETPLECLIREGQEEVGVTVKQAKKVAELTFEFIDKPENNHFVEVFTIAEWSGEPSESDEMKPSWFKVADILYESMWKDDKFWLPEILAGETLHAKFVFNLEGEIIENTITLTKFTK
jgi:8-oxo-dGTP diphosphatase